MLHWQFFDGNNPPPLFLEKQFTCSAVIVSGISAAGRTPGSPGLPDGRGRIYPDCWGVLC